MKPRTAQCAYFHALDDLARAVEQERNAVLAGSALTTGLPMVLAEVAIARKRIAEGRNSP